MEATDTMICGYCGKPGIHWENLTGWIPYTVCPHCGGINCQEPEEEEQYREEEKDNDLLYWELEADARKDKEFYADRREVKDG